MEEVPLPLVLYQVLVDLLKLVTVLEEIDALMIGYVVHLVVSILGMKGMLIVILLVVVVQEETLEGAARRRGLRTGDTRRWPTTNPARDSRSSRAGARTRSNP